MLAKARRRRARYFPETATSLEVSTPCDKQGEAARWRLQESGGNRTYLTGYCELLDTISVKAFRAL